MPGIRPGWTREKGCSRTSQSSSRRALGSPEAHSLFVVLESRSGSGSCWLPPSPTAMLPDLQVRRDIHASILRIPFTIPRRPLVPRPGGERRREGKRKTCTSFFNCHLSILPLPWKVNGKGWEEMVSRAFTSQWAWWSRSPGMQVAMDLSSRGAGLGPSCLRADQLLVLLLFMPCRSRGLGAIGSPEFALAEDGVRGPSSIPIEP